MTNKILDEIVDRMFPNRKEYNLGSKNFDYPDYGGLPKSISYKLSPEAVDAIQHIMHDESLSFSRKRDFRKAIKDEMIRLGEPFIRVMKCKA